MVSARPNRSRVDFVVLGQLEPATGPARVQVEIRAVTALAGAHDALSAWVGRTMTAVLPTGTTWPALGSTGGSQVASGYASLVGPGEIRLVPAEQRADVPAGLGTGLPVDVPAALGAGLPVDVSTGPAAGSPVDLGAEQPAEGPGDVADERGPAD